MCDCRKRYDKVEKEFIDAKLELHKRTENKEQLTEHLYAIIQANELRKASKLGELMEKLNMDIQIESEISSLVPAVAIPTPSILPSSKSTHDPKSTQLVTPMKAEEGTAELVSSITNKKTASCQPIRNENSDCTVSNVTDNMVPDSTALSNQFCTNEAAAYTIVEESNVTKTGKDKPVVPSNDSIKYEEKKSLINKEQFDEDVKSSQKKYDTFITDIPQLIPENKSHVDTKSSNSQNVAETGDLKAVASSCVNTNSELVLSVSTDVLDDSHAQQLSLNSNNNTDKVYDNNVKKLKSKPYLEAFQGL